MYINLVKEVVGKYSQRNPRPNIENPLKVI